MLHKIFRFLFGKKNVTKLARLPTLKVTCTVHMRIKNNISGVGEMDFTYQKAAT